MKKTLMVVFTIALFAAPAFAADSGMKPLSLVEFRSLRENSGVPQKIVDNRYAEYRSGRYAVTTLDTAHIR